MFIFYEAVNVIHTFFCLRNNKIPANWKQIGCSSKQQMVSKSNTYRKLGRLKLCRKTMQLTRPRACTTSSLTLAVAVAVNANTGVFGNFCFKIPRPWT